VSGTSLDQINSECQSIFTCKMYRVGQNALRTVFEISQQNAGKRW